MKQYIVLLFAAFSLISSTTSYALHGYISDSNTIQYCNGFCDLIDSLEVGSTVSLTGQMDTTEEEVLNTLFDFTIEISGSSSTLFLTSSNTSLISSNIFTSTDEFEETTIFGGTAIFDTTFSFSELSGVPTELIYNFNNNSINLLISDNIIASTAVVPVPTAVWLFGSGLLGLIGVTRRKKA
jgi:hypothetical protein